jgi:hypothetical protein
LTLFAVNERTCINMVAGVFQADGGNLQHLQVCLLDCLHASGKHEGRLHKDDVDMSWMALKRGLQCRRRVLGLGSDLNGIFPYLDDEGITVDKWNDGVYGELKIAREQFATNCRNSASHRTVQPVIRYSADTLLALRGLPQCRAKVSRGAVLPQLQGNAW